MIILIDWRNRREVRKKSMCSRKGNYCCRQGHASYSQPGHEDGRKDWTAVYHCIKTLQGSHVRGVSRLEIVKAGGQGRRAGGIKKGRAGRQDMTYGTSQLDLILTVGSTARHLLVQQLSFQWTWHLDTFSNVNFLNVLNVNLSPS
jgi:hypothetical protein